MPGVQVKATCAASAATLPPGDNLERNEADNWSAVDLAFTRIWGNGIIVMGVTNLRSIAKCDQVAPCGAWS